MVGAGLTIVGGATWYATLPRSAAAALAGASALNVLVLIIFATTAGVVLMMYWGPWRNPSWLTPGFTILFFGAGPAAVGTGEFIRESVRKPYVVCNRVLGNGIRPEEIPGLRRSGYLPGGVWTRACLAENYPDLVVNAGKGAAVGLDGSRLLSMSADRRRAIGRTIFMYHCNDCHAVQGYSAVSQLARGWNRQLVHETVTHLDEVRFFMPPWSGTEPEAQALADYIVSVRSPYPQGFAHEKREVR